MNLPRLSQAFDLAELRRMLPDILGRIVREDMTNRKSNADVELAGNQRLILLDTVTGTRYVVSVASGVVTLTAL